MRRHAERGEVVPLLPGEGAPALADEALIAACALGDAGALAALFERHRERLHRFCARIASADAAEDLVQETFVAAWTHAARFRGRSSVRAWLLGIAANLARKRRRGGVRRDAAMASLRVIAGASTPDPEGRVADRQTLDRLAAGIAALPHALRVAFVLCEIEGLSGADAARALGIRQGTLWRRLHDARRRLLPLLDGEER